MLPSASAASSARSSVGSVGGGSGGGGGSRYVEVPARVHCLQSLSSDDGFSEGESVHEVSVVLHPVGPDGGPSEKRMLREELKRCRQQLGQQRRALQMAHAALCAEITHAAGSRFVPETALMRRCIEYLIDKEYMARLDTDREMYVYCP